jgi:hypothetical protein
MWHPAPADLAAWRASVVGDRSSVHAVLGDPVFRSTFGTVDGERLERAPTGFGADDRTSDLPRLNNNTFRRPVRRRGKRRSISRRRWPTRFPPLPRLLAVLPGHEAPVGWLRGLNPAGQGEIQPGAPADRPRPRTAGRCCAERRGRRRGHRRGYRGRVELRAVESRSVTSAGWPLRSGGRRGRQRGPAGRHGRHPPTSALRFGA